MRVKISYSVELDDVPRHVTKLLADAKQSLVASSTSLAGVLSDIEEKKDVLNIVESLTILRQTLFNLDSVFSDVGDILIGYENTLLSQQLSEAEEETPQEKENE